jgi:uncharacterized membrane protein
MLVLRYFNVYGGTLPWEHKAQIVDTLRSFFNFSKYPASLLFILTTLSIGFVMLVALDSINAQKGIFKAIKTIGSVPMLAYFLHLYALLVIYWICYWIVGPTQGTRFGFDYVWQIWLGALVLSALIYYPLERFSKYKHKHKHQKPWLSYL